MGIRLYLYALSDRTLQRMAEHPEQLDDILDDVAKPPMDMSGASPLLDRLTGLVNRMKPTLEEGENISIDKAWHALHFLLTGTAWDGEPPLDLLLNGGVEVTRHDDEEDDEENDEGDVFIRCCTAREVAAFSQALQSIDSEELRRRFVPEQLLQSAIYPYMGLEPRRPDEEDLRYCLLHFDRLKSFVDRAARSSLGLLTSRG